MTRFTVAAARDAIVEIGIGFGVDAGAGESIDGSASTEGGAPDRAGVPSGATVSEPRRIVRLWPLADRGAGAGADADADAGASAGAGAGTSAGSDDPASKALLCWHAADVELDLVGQRYRVRVDGGPWRPDPASRWNPDDVHGDSVVVASDYRWQHRWRGLPWHRAVIAELHIGGFTGAGTFAAAIERLPALAAVGITAVEVMPVADFAGRRNWGYDGVLPFAPDSSYGSPDDFRRFVDAAHGLGLAVFLDVVYNHFGPDGAYLHQLAPAFFDPARPTPWGPGLRVSGPGSAPVRRFFIENAWYWIDGFGLDGLRLDAIHAIQDDSPVHLVAEIAATLAERIAALPAERRRPIHLIVENEANEASRLERDANGEPRVAVAQWNDDIHHALHVLLTGEQDGYYADFATEPARLLADGLANGFIYRGQLSAHAGAPRGEPSAHLPPTAMINFLQNHDQIGNRAFGERITALAEPAAIRVATGCVLLGPAIPMLFMGDDFAATTPFRYFVDFDGELARAVRDGRRREFARFARFADPAFRDRIPDPTAESTFVESKLDWPEDDDNADTNDDAAADDANDANDTDDADSTADPAFRAFVGACLAARRQWVEPLLAVGDVPSTRYRLPSSRTIVVEWRFRAGVLALAANFGPADAAPVELPIVDGARPVFRAAIQPAADPTQPAAVPPRPADPGHQAGRAAPARDPGLDAALAPFDLVLYR